MDKNSKHFNNYVKAKQKRNAIHPYTIIKVTGWISQLLGAEMENRMKVQPHIVDVRKRWRSGTWAACFRTADVVVMEDDLKTMPICIKFSKLDIKFMGNRCLNKLAEMTGDFIKEDGATSNRDKLLYAKVLVEVRVDHHLPNSISFVNEKGIVVDQIMECEWRPYVCTACKCLGHLVDKYRKAKTKRWV
ncbi:DNA-directed RNA polymerase subunit beta' [Bienertia sinuspersici]